LGNKSIEGKQCSVTENINFPQNNRSKWESPERTNAGKETQTLKAGEKGRNYVIMTQSPNPSSYFSRENFPWWLPTAVCSSLIGLVAVLGDRFMKGNAMGLLVF